MRRILPVFLAALAVAPLTAGAKDLFTVTTTGAADLTVTGSKLPDLLKDAIKAEGDFAALGSNSATVSLNYAGMANAIVVDIVAPPGGVGSFTATLQLPGFSKTFTGTSKDDLQTQIKDFFKDDESGRKAVLKALKRIYAGTPITITDGTPHAHAAAASLDILQTGVEVGGGVTNRVGYNLGVCTVQMANQLRYYQGLDVMGYDTGVKQEILKNGLSVCIPVAGGWLVEPKLIYTNFLQDAAIPNYWTFGADLVYRSPGLCSWSLFLVPDDFYVGLAYDTDLKDYSSPNARMGVWWKW